MIKSELKNERWFYGIEEVEMELLFPQDQIPSIKKIIMLFF